MRFSILGTLFTLEADRPERLRYVHAFIGAYDRSIEETITADASIRVREGDLPAGGQMRVAPVHRSKHPYWNFDAHWMDAGAIATWPARGIAVRLSASGASVVVPRRTSEATAGEAVFHVCRSLALYRRRASSGNFLHASAANIRGRAVLFCGQSSSGKTTLLTQAVARSGAHPMANDRVVVSRRPGLDVTSWPSYASYCEGTLLDYAPLRAAAERYERSDCPHRTLSWPHPLRPLYDKQSKRIYPMGWLADAFDVRYTRCAALGALIFPTISSSGPHVVTRWQLDDPATRGRLAHELDRLSFDRVEPSFLPWHGLSVPQGAPAVANLVDRLHAAHIPVYSLTCPPGDYRLFERLLKGELR